MGSAGEEREVPRGTGEVERRERVATSRRFSAGDTGRSPTVRDVTSGVDGVLPTGSSGGVVIPPLLPPCIALSQSLASRKNTTRERAHTEGIGPGCACRAGEMEARGGGVRPYRRCPSCHTAERNDGVTNHAPYATAASNDARNGWMVGVTTISAWTG